jgi:hypothetical protein
MTKINLNPSEVKEAITEGVKEAFLEMVENMILTAPFIHAVEEGVNAAVSHHLCISDDFEEKVLDAISIATRRAMSEIHEEKSHKLRD